MLRVSFALFALFALAIGMPAQAADPEPIHLLTASRVVVNINGEEGEELSPWIMNINLMKDIKKSDSGGLSESITSYTVRFDKLKIDGTKYDAAKSSWTDPHHEVMQWYSLNWPVGVLEEKGGVINLVPLKDKQRADTEGSFKTERVKIVAGWGPGWDHIDLDTMRAKNVEKVGKAAVVRDPFNPPGRDSKPFQRPAVQVPLCKPKVD